jgi:ribosomal protein S18 acetylase RimI-like enzyme
MILRPATPADAPALAALGRDAFVDKFGHLYSPENLAAFLEGSHSEAKVAKELSDPGMAIMLAERGGVMAGMCMLVLDSSLKEHGTALRPLELKQLYTAAGQTGGGIGAALMDWALEFARSHGADEVQLSVWSENEGAHRFYYRYGFRKIADIHFWVGDHCDDEYCFALRL